jgi:flagella basal body P-ring formation protein FlgA
MMHLIARSRAAALAFTLAVLALLVAAYVVGAHAQDAGADAPPPLHAYVAPTRVIYPRQTIRPDMIEARQADALPGAIALSFDEVIGKAARATLLPGRVIPLAALGEPEAVKMGGAVTLRFRAAGIDLRAAGVAMQPGAAGERIRARNAATGVVVSGLLREDGSVIVEGEP